jgi:hypothetical protein
VEPEPSQEFLAALIDGLKPSRDREFLQSLINERDRQYDTRFKAAEDAVTTALAAQEKAVNAAFLASEKAVLKAEQAQKEYNERSNEFRGQLDDQASTLMPRTESTAVSKAIEEKIAAHVMTSKNEMEAIKNSFERQHDAQQADILALREARSAGTGKDLARQGYIEERRSSLALVVSVVFGVLAFGVADAAFFKHP